MGRVTHKTAHCDNVGKTMVLHICVECKLALSLVHKSVEKSFLKLLDSHIAYDVATLITAGQRVSAAPPTSMRHMTPGR